VASSAGRRWPSGARGTAWPGWRGLIRELPEGPGLAVARELVLGDEDLDPAELRPAFEAYERELEARGLTRDEEALRLEGELQADLA
jgi:hypothetical protein